MIRFKFDSSFSMDGIRENISMKRRITKKKSQKQRKEEMNSRKAEGLNRNLPTDELIFEVKTVCPWYALIVLNLFLFD